MEVLEEPTFSKERYEEYWKYVVERQRIWYKRFVLRESHPWTSDPILQKYRFCNNYRELDKGTMHLIDKLESLKTDRGKVLFNVVLYRFFNSHRFFDKLGGLFDPSDYNPYNFIKTLDKLISKGESIYNPAYVVCPPTIKPEYRPNSKHVQLAFALEILSEKIDELIEKIDSANTPKDSLDALKEIPGVNNFLAYEFWTDLTYFNFFAQGWTDNDFVNVGPGARWGMNIIMGKDTKDRLFSQEGYLKLIFYLRDKMPEALEQLGLKEEWLKISYKKAYSNVPFLSLRNTEHSLCEFRKYWRIKNGRGRRRLYKLEQKSQEDEYP
jgi:hypothetical protein